MKRLPTLTLIAAGTLWTQIASAETITWKVDGETRLAFIYAPSTKSAGEKAPLVFSFHGHGDDIQNFQYTGIHRMCPGAAAVSLQGLASGHGLLGWQEEKRECNDRYLKLVDAALPSLRGMIKVDGTRIYATGFSNGANFTYLLWAERPGLFAAYAPVAA